MTATETTALPDPREAEVLYGVSILARFADQQAARAADRLGAIGAELAALYDDARRRAEQIEDLQRQLTACRDRMAELSREKARLENSRDAFGGPHILPDDVRAEIERYLRDLRLAAEKRAASLTDKSGRQSHERVREYQDAAREEAADSRTFWRLADVRSRIALGRQRFGLNRESRGEE